jgi:acetyltransferase-like isoleucine patch superfamily enzyme
MELHTEPRGVYKIGKDVVIQATAILIGDNKIEIGDGSWIGSYCNLRPVDHKIVIGKNVLIAQMVSIISDSHEYRDVNKPMKEQGIFGADIIIEDNVWVGCNSVILHGVRIGTGSIVSAGSIVTKNIPPYSIVAGVPAKIIKRYSFKSKKWIKYNNFMNRRLFKMGFI